MAKIQSACRLVKNQYLLSAKDSRRNRNTLFLTATRSLGFCLFPSMQTVPFCFLKIPLKADTKVDFPAPFFPMIAVMFPA